MDPKITSGLSICRSKVAAITIAVFIFVMVTFAALWFSFSAETRLFEKQTLRTTQQINEKVTLAIGTLHSMGAAHQASSNGFDHRQFEMFADNLVTNQSAITATGRYDMLLHDDLDYFKSELQLHGMFMFTPKSITDNGNIVPLGTKQQYSTLVSFFPQDPVSANFIGLDLSEIDATQNAIVKSVQTYSPVATVIPTPWFAKGQINVFAPSYFGHYIPDNMQDRQLQTDGGYFITMDLVEIVNQSTEVMFPLTIGIALHSASNGKLIVNQAPRILDERFISSLFTSHTIEHNLAIGNGSATIIYGTPAGVTRSQIGSAIGKGLGAFFLFSILGTIALIHRASQAQILANEKALARERERALVTLNSLQDSVITTDSGDRIDYLNPAALRAFKTSRIDLLGKPLHEVLETYFHSDNSAKPDDADAQKNHHSISAISSIKRLITDTDDEIVFNCKSSAITNNSNGKIGSVLTMRDISKEHALTTELAHQATHDALTGLPNRRKFESIINAILQDPEAREVSYHTIAYIDLDQFKLVNDTAGHAAGDELLKKLAKDLLLYAPENIEVARLGGDEFGIFCSHMERSHTEEIANLFHEFFQSYFYQTQDNIFSIRASIGLTTIKPHHVTINDVLSEVDIACYTAKDAGRNNFIVYDSEDQDTKDREGEMLYLPILQSAMKNDRFVLYTQPIVSTDNVNEFISHHYECLLRLIDDNGDIITPYKFIVAAERYDLIRDIDKWVIENAFSQISAFKNTPLQDTIFSINLSGQSAIDITMPDFIESMLNQYKIKSSNICFELTETAVISNFTQAQKLITFLRERGCTIALDDFGAGASSFGYLKNLEVDYLKIDGQFVKEMTSNKVDYEMVRSMNNVGEALGIKTIAEFVESADIMQALSDINVDYAQGYHVGKPAPMENLLNAEDIKVAA